VNGFSVNDFESYTFCRQRTLEILLMAYKNEEQRNARVSEMPEAKECWKKTLLLYLNYPLDTRYGSHVIFLSASAWVTDGAILEMGSGWFSTPMFHRLSNVQNRYVLTSDLNYEWLAKFILFSSASHELYLVNSKKAGAKNNSIHEVKAWEDIGHQQNHWGLIFIDQSPASQRHKDLKRLRDRADILVVHDTEPGQERLYRIQEVIKTFKYRTTLGKDWSNIFTDVVSDSRPELIFAIEILCQWGVEMLGNMKS